MQLRQLGSTSTNVPAVGLGTWRFAGDLTSVVDSALAEGAWLIDTAEWYENEELVGRAIGDRRDQVFIATKVNPWHLRVNDLIAAAERSLRRFGFETIGLYQIHAPDALAPIDESMEPMDRLVRDGKVRHVGVSNFSVNELAEAERALGAGRIVSNQIKLSLLDHMPGDSVLPYCLEHHISVISYSTLEKGGFDERAKQRPGLADAMDRVREEVGCTHGPADARLGLAPSPRADHPDDDQPQARRRELRRRRRRPDRRAARRAHRRRRGPGALQVLVALTPRITGWWR
jgi:diketogulonate reductase-like aldo/keto reductase